MNATRNATCPGQTSRRSREYQCATESGSPVQVDRRHSACHVAQTTLAQQIICRFVDIAPCNLTPRCAARKIRARRRAIRDLGPGPKTRLLVAPERKVPSIARNDGESNRARNSVSCERECHSETRHRSFAIGACIDAKSHFQ